MHVLQSRVLLRPRDFDRSVAFYETSLGLVRYREWGKRPHRGVVYFLGGGFLELSESGSGERPGGMRLWLQVADVHAVERDLQARGVDIAAAAARQPWGLLEMVVEDPDGLALVIVETPLDHPLRRDQR
ncbi:MAG: VOC family protein [Nitriliruptorales bacterium]|nr:VOC family protein [Nitriliruptorales bacterium]